MLGLPRSLWGEVARFGFVIQGLSLWVVVGRSVNSLVFFIDTAVQACWWDCL